MPHWFQVSGFGVILFRLHVRQDLYTPGDARTLPLLDCMSQPSKGGCANKDNQYQILYQYCSRDEVN